MKIQITISTLLTAIGGYLVTLTEPTWLPIVGGLLLAAAGAFGKTAYNSYQRGRNNQKIKNAAFVGNEKK